MNQTVDTAIINPTSQRQLMPALAHQHNFNHGGQAPLPAPLHKRTG